jgi:deglycase
MRLEGKIIGILVGPGYEDLEFWVPYMRMQEEGAQVKVIGSKAGETYTSKSGGLTVESAIAADAIDADRLDALLVPGGWAPDKLRRDKNILKLVREMNEQGKILGFICHAGWVAASAGICKGRRVTGSTGIRDDMHNAGAFWVDEPAFREGNLVWGRVVADIPDYCRELITALS